MKGKTFENILLIATSFAFFSFDLPKNWFAIDITSPKMYEMWVDKGKGPEGKNAATIKSVYISKGFGTGILMQMCTPGRFIGHKIRMTGYMKSESVQKWAGFWLRVNSEGSIKPLTFDNMENDQ